MHICFKSIIYRDILNSVIWFSRTHTEFCIIPVLYLNDPRWGSTKITSVGTLKLFTVLTEKKNVEHAVLAVQRNY